MGNVIGEDLAVLLDMVNREEGIITTPNITIIFRG